MKLDVGGIPETLKRQGVREGNVYRNQKSNYYLIVSVFLTRGDNETAVALRVERDGSITNAVCYPTYYFDGLALVGFANLPEMLSIEWMIP